MIRPLGMDIFNRIFKLNTYQPLNTIEISRKNLISNYKYLYKYLKILNSKIKIAPVLKSNAYGHGLIEIAKILEGCGSCPFFCVDSIYEAYELLKAGIKTKILIMGYVTPENLKVKKLPFSYAVFDLKFIQALANLQPEAGVHLFVDTGMHREGINLTQLPIYLQHLKRIQGLRLEGLMSHLASAEEPKNRSNTIQIKNFKLAKKMVEDFGFRPKWFHLFATKSLLNYKSLPRFDSLTNMARVGMGLLGIDPTGKTHNLKPVLKLKTKIVQIKKIKKGELVGYSGTFRAKKNLTLGILPIGYFDGVDRRLSNRGFVTINGIACRVVGLVSMNITTVDLTKGLTELSKLSKRTTIPIGQTVLIYSENLSDPNSIENTARLCKATPYEILVHLAPTTKRVIVD